MSTINDLILAKYPDVHVNQGKDLAFLDLLNGASFNQSAVYQALQDRFPSAEARTFNDLFKLYLTQNCQAIRFNGANNYGQLATPITIPANTDFEIEFAFSSADDGGFAGFLSSDVTSTSGDFLRFLPTSQSSNLQMSIGGQFIGMLPRSQITLRDGQFRVLKITRESGTITPFVDGVSYASTSGRDGAFTIAAIGRLGSSFFSGLLPWIRIDSQYYAMAAVGQAVQPSLPAGNDMTLFNTVPEQWEEISCGLRPQV